MNKLWGLIKRHKIITSILFTAVMVTAVLGVQITPTKTLNKSSVSIGQIGQKYEITIGSGVDASTTADYTATGTAAQQTNTFQIALNALPTTGGILTILSGNYTLNATLTRAIPNVTIEGIGNSTIFSDNGSTPIFAAGSTGWNFQNLVLDAGGISGTCTGSNITIGTTYYSVYGGLNAPTGRTASYVIAASDAPASVKAQADAVVTTDVGALINAAIVLGYRDIYLSQGISATSFPVLTTIVIPTQTYLHGAGKYVTVLTLSADTTMIQFATGATNGSQITLRDMAFEGNNRGYSNTSHCIEMLSVDSGYSGHCTLENLWINKFLGQGLIVNDYADSKFDNIEIANCGEDGGNVFSLIGEAGLYCNENTFRKLQIDADAVGCGSGIFVNPYCFRNAFYDTKLSVSVTGNYGFLIQGQKTLIDGGVLMESIDAIKLVRIEDGAWGGATENTIQNMIIGGDSVHATTYGIYITTAYPQQIINNRIDRLAVGVQGTQNYSRFALNNFSNNTVGIAASGVEAWIQENNFLGNVTNITGKVWEYIYDNRGIPDGWIKPGEIRTASGTLTGGAANAILFAWHNPEAQDILIKRVVLYLTAGDADAANIDVGIADNATYTNGGTEFFDDLTGETTGVYDSIATVTLGKQTVWVLCQDSASATDGWVVAKILTNDGTSIAGSYYIEYVGK